MDMDDLDLTACLCGQSLGCGERCLRELRTIDRHQDLLEHCRSSSKEPMRPFATRGAGSHRTAIMATPHRRPLGSNVTPSTDPNPKTPRSHRNLGDAQATEKPGRSRPSTFSLAAG